MSRSYRKTPIAGVAGNNCTSEKHDKRLAARRWRRVNRQRLHGLGPDYHPAVSRELTSCWGWNKDGKRWFDVRCYPGVLRK